MWGCALNHNYQQGSTALYAICWLSGLLGKPTLAARKADFARGSVYGNVAHMLMWVVA